MKLFILLFIVSCGKPTKDCVSGQEKRLTCKAELVGRYYPANPSEFELNQCDLTYQNNACY